MMLHEFLTANRQILIARCREKVAKRFGPSESAAAIDNGVPLFLQQLVDTLQVEQHTYLRDTVDGISTLAPTAIGLAAALHGAELLRRGFSVDQVVHDYGDVCQSVMALAIEQKCVISVDEFRSLNRCLDNAIAYAVASFGAARLASMERKTETLQQRMAVYAAEQQRLVDIAVRLITAIKTGSIGMAGPTGTLLTETLIELRSLTDRTMAEILLTPPGGKAASA
jgi:hypothetical protein